MSTAFAGCLPITNTEFLKLTRLDALVSKLPFLSPSLALCRSFVDHNRFPSSLRKACQVAAPKMERPDRVATPLPSGPLLESLPAEMRTKILLIMPDLPTLRSLVRASPVMHAQYLHDRYDVLRTCLRRELDDVYPDAYICAMTDVRFRPMIGTKELIKGFID